MNRTIYHHSYKNNFFNECKHIPSIVTLPSPRDLKTFPELGFINEKESNFDLDHICSSLSGICFASKTTEVLLRVSYFVMPKTIPVA